MKTGTDDKNARSRFSNRVADYIKYRPDYPTAALKFLQAQVPTPAKVADIGSGTGIFSRQLLAAGYNVFALEPNDDMRQAAEEASVGESRLHSVKGSDNDTTLESLSINLITAAQAFHWFDPTAFRAECERILKPGGSVALLWNERLDDTTEFAREYEQLLQQFSTDYQEVDHRSVGREKMDRFWRPGEEVIERSFPHTIHMTREGMHGRVRSSSYVPAPGKPGHEEMCAALNALFDREQQGGTVPYHYACKIYFARLR